MRKPQIPTSDPDDNGEASANPFARWCVIIWSAWGALIAILVLWLDQNPIAAALFGIGGVVAGIWGPRILESLMTPMFNACRSFADDPVRDRRICELVMSGKAESDELHELIEEEMFGPMLSTPPFVGLIHGVFLGGLVGAIIGGIPGLLDSNLDSWAAAGALFGALLGPVLASFVCSITFAFSLPMGNRLPPRVRCARRALMAISPLLLPVAAWRFLRAWQYVRWLRHRERFQ